MFWHSYCHAFLYSYAFTSQSSCYVVKAITSSPCRSENVRRIVIDVPLDANAFLSLSFWPSDIRILVLVYRVISKTQDSCQISLRWNRIDKFSSRKLISFPFWSVSQLNGDDMNRLCSYWKVKKIMRIFDNFIPVRDICKERVNCVCCVELLTWLPEIISILTSILLIVWRRITHFEI